MSEANRFGPIIDGDDVERAVAASLGEWIDDYLGEEERLKGIDRIERPRGIVVSSDWELWDGEQIPVYLVLSAGLAKPPVRRGNGEHDAEWTVGVSPVVADQDASSTRRLGMAHAAAVRSALTQHGSLKSAAHPDGFSERVRWEDETYTEVPFANTRTLFAPIVLFVVTVNSVLDARRGPETPSGKPATDPGPLPVATDVKIEPVLLEVS